MENRTNVKTDRSQKTEEVMTKGVLEVGPSRFFREGWMETLYNLEKKQKPLRRGK
jgi:hypothetical protein